MWAKGCFHVFRLSSIFVLHCCIQYHVIWDRIMIASDRIILWRNKELISPCSKLVDKQLWKEIHDVRMTKLLQLIHKCIKMALIAGIPCYLMYREHAMSDPFTRKKIKSILRITPTTIDSYSNDLGWGLLSQFPPFRYFPKFSASPKYMLAIVYHVHIWQVLPQLSCGDTCQIWMWCK